MADAGEETTESPRRRKAPESASALLAGALAVLGTGGGGIASFLRVSGQLDEVRTTLAELRVRLEGVAELKATVRELETRVRLLENNHGAGK